MEQNREESKRNSGEHPGRNERPGGKTTGDKEKSRENDKRTRILQCMGNLNALHKVQGALLGQMEKEIE